MRNQLHGGAIVCLFEVEAREVWLRGAAGGVLVALVERHVANQYHLLPVPFQVAPPLLSSPGVDRANRFTV